MSKKYIIRGLDHYFLFEDTSGGYKINPSGRAVRLEFEGGDAMQVSDGSHTMDELYEHRYTLWIALCRKYETLDCALNLNPIVWRSKCHDDGELAFGGGWFVLGIGKEAGKTMTYHLPLSFWDQTDFAETLARAPEFDGHTASDVLQRLKNL